MTRPQTPVPEDIGIVGLIAIGMIVVCIVGMLVLGCPRSKDKPHRLTTVPDPLF